MFWLGLALPVCFIAGITGATIPTQLPVLSATLPAMVLWRHVRMTPWHWLVLAFVAYSVLSLFWAINPRDSVYGLWQALVWALAFRLGSDVPDLFPLWRGLAIGLSVSSAVAIGQAAGFVHLPSADYDHPAGLLFNGAVQGGMIALVILALVADRAWLFIPAMLPGLYLAHSRGAWLVLATGLLSRLHWGAAVLAVIAAGAAAYLLDGPTDVLRLQVWSVAWQLLTPFGHGIGSFADVFYGSTRPEYVHNDYLQLAFELGIGAIPLFVVAAAALSRHHERYFPILVGFAVLSLFFFPLYCAPLAFIGAVVAGHVLGRDDPVFAFGRGRRPGFVAGISDRQFRHGSICGRDFSVPSRNQAKGALNAAL